MNISTYSGKVVTLIERFDGWWSKTAKPQLVRIEKTPDYLAGRIIYCAECGKSSTLWRYQGRMVCSTCSSDSWHYPVPLFSFVCRKNAKKKATARQVG